MSRLAPHLQELVDRARERVSIADLSTVREGRRGPCPLCLHKKGKKDTAFSHYRGGRWHCFRCDAGGDAIDLYVALHGVDTGRLDAARLILGLPLDRSGDRAVSPASQAERQKRERVRAERERKAERSRERSAAYHAQVMAELDHGAHQAITSAGVTRWLREGRGLPVDLLDDALRLLSAVPSAHYFEDFDTGEVFEHPAMMGVIVDPVTDEPCGRHVTYLARNGLVKANVEAPRKIWGSARGGVWLTARDRTQGPLFVAEGIETTLSMLAAWRIKHGKHSGRGLAVLSLKNLQGGIFADQYGRINIDVPRPDPAMPAVAWPHMGKVIPGPDHDMSPLEVKLRRPKGGTERVMMTATQRMEVCGVLASYWWRRAGADDVVVARPPLGMDFNDALRAERSAQREVA